MASLLAAISEAGPTLWLDRWGHLGPSGVISQEDALDHYAEEATEVRANLVALVTSLRRRFGDRTLPETYRASLQTLKKQPRETLEEYAARVRKLANRAYPGISGTSLLEEMTIEYLVGGLTDQNLIYNVMTKKPRSVEAALVLIQWHESCRGVQRKGSGVRQLAITQGEDDTITAVRRTNSKAYVTEERLHQFGRELKDGIVQEIKKELGNQRWSGRRGQSNPRWKETMECFHCHNLGHFARECPSAAEGEPTDGLDVQEAEGALN